VRALTAVALVAALGQGVLLTVDSSPVDRTWGSASGAALALALAAGVILGRYLTQPLKRAAHRVETRLSGPRMVGPFRRRSAKNK
jgi:uncharacterized membrane protein YjjB (DUF3815 family)